MNGHNVTGLVDPTQDDMAASKGYTDSNFLDIAGGTMVGDIGMNGHDVTHLPNIPPTDNPATSKKYVDDGTMTGDINMGGYEVIGVTSVPSFNNSLVNKKYVDDEITSGLTGVSGGITQAQADGRYVRKMKLMLGEWTDVYDDVGM